MCNTLVRFGDGHSESGLARRNDNKKMLSHKNKLARKRTHDHNVGDGANTKQVKTSLKNLNAHSKAQWKKTKKNRLIKEKKETLTDKCKQNRPQIDFTNLPTPPTNNP